MGLILILFIVIIFFIVLNKFNEDASEYICEKLDYFFDLVNSACKSIANKFSNYFKLYTDYLKVLKSYFKLNDLRFDINGSVTATSREVRKDKINYISYHKVTNHFTSESEV